MSKLLRSSKAICEAQATSFRGLTLETDMWRYRGRDRVLPLISGEQDLICDYARFEPGERVLDVGTGSGVLGLFAAARGCRVTGVDISHRAIEFARHNAFKNGLDVNWIHGAYSSGILDPHSFDCVVMNPPHQPTIECCPLALHSDGGRAGLGVFREWLTISAYHVKPAGRVIFFQLSPGSDAGPALITVIQDTIGKRYTLRYSKALMTISYQSFIAEVYEGCPINQLSKQYSEFTKVDLLIGEIQFNCVQHPGDILEPRRFAYGDSWSRRLALHNLITVMSCTHEG